MSINISKSTAHINNVKVLIVFNDMTAEVISNKNLNQMVPELLIRGRKPHISTVFMTQSYFAEPKDVRPNYSHFLNKSHFIIHQISTLKTL